MSALRSWPPPLQRVVIDAGETTDIADRWWGASSNAIMTDDRPRTEH